MKTIIAGSRTVVDIKIVEKAIWLSGFNISEVVSGGAWGVDALGEKIANRQNISIKMFSADWNKYGRSAGPIRNKEMVKYADALIAVWNGKSKGTKHQQYQYNH